MSGVARFCLPLRPPPAPWRKQHPPGTLSTAAWSPWTALSPTRCQTPQQLLPPPHSSRFHSRLQPPQVSRQRCSRSCPALSRLQPALINAPVDCACCCAGAPLLLAGTSEPRMDGKHQLCEKCGERLSRVKHHRAHGPGRACHPRCKLPERTADGAADAPAAATPPPPSRKRRAQSDPGEPRTRTPSPRRTRPTTRRVTPPKPAPAPKKQRTTRQEEIIMRLLDETHARRMAAMAADS